MFASARIHGVMRIVGVGSEISLTVDLVASMAKAMRTRYERKEAPLR